MRSSSHDARLTKQTCAILVYVIIYSKSVYRSFYCLPRVLCTAKVFRRKFFDECEDAWSRGKEMAVNAYTSMAYHIRYSLRVEGLVESGDEVMIEESRGSQWPAKNVSSVWGSPRISDDPPASQT